MRFVKMEQNMAAETLLAILTSALEKYPTVAWFVPGGSNIDIAVRAMAQIPVDLTEKLVIAQTDERYGPIGHPDSNWKQLMDAGFKPGKAMILPVLAGENLSLDDTVSRYNKVVAEILKDAYKIGQFGIGADGHIAGIKPQTPSSVASGSLVFGYENNDFTRITLTFDAIKQMNEIHTFAFGQSKKNAIEQLANGTHQLMLQPSQIVKSVDSSSVYNDFIGDKTDEAS